MALPVYTNDLTTIATGDKNFDAGIWSESSDAGFDTAGAMVDDENNQYVKTSINSGEPTDSCTSQQYTKAGNSNGNAGPGSIMYTHTAAFTVPTNGVVLIDDLWAAPSALNLYAGTFGTAEAGVSVMIGTTAGDFDLHYVSGSDKPPAPKGGWTTYCVDPTITPAGTIGTVTTINTVGVAIAALAQARGNPHACQSVRYGRAEVEYTVGDATTPATFEGYAVLDNAAADRFNLLEYTDSGYKARGLMSFGTAATAVYFKDSDKSIVIADDLKVSSVFNAGVVNNASSTLDWTNISIKNIGTVAKYSLLVNDGATTVTNGGVFEGVGAFTYGANSIQNNVTYRGQEIVQGGTYNTCLFDKAVGLTASISTTLNNYNTCTFNSSGSGYGIDISGTTISADTTMSWTSTSTGYTDTAGNRTIKATVDGTAILTINNDSGNTLFVENIGTSTAGTNGNGIEIVSGLVTLSIATQDGNEVRLRQGSYTIQHNQNVTGGIETYTYTYTAGTQVTISVGAAGFERQMIDYGLTASDTTLLFTLVASSSYI